MSLTPTQRKRERQERILMELDKMTFATREQIQTLFGLGSDRNALRVLKEMNDYLQIRNHNGRNVYYLSSIGRELIGSEKEVKWNLQADHYLMRNDMYLFFQQPTDWRVEEPIYFKYQNGLIHKEMRLTPDATFTRGGKYYFLEVDRTQSMKENKEKIQNYSYLLPSFRQQYKDLPTLVFYTLTDYRKQKLKEVSSTYEVPYIVYTKEDTI